MTNHLHWQATGPAVTIQDLGRPGLAHLGLAASGAMDPDALRLANHLVGNAPGTAAIELGPGGAGLRVDAEAVRIALAGAAMSLRCAGRPLAGWRSHTLTRGQTLAIGAARSGAWAYLGVAGGLAIEPVLGSRATHSRAGIGGLEGRRLLPGDRLALGALVPPDGPELALQEPPQLAATAPIRVVLGPQAEHFGPDALALFLGSAYRVSSAADRMGYRLEGPPLTHAMGFNIVSDGVLPGSVQVPGNGQPIVMLMDHQTTGGYPKIATVISADLPLLAQRQPGDEVRFDAVELGAADAARRTAAERFAAAIGRIVPVGRQGGLEPERLLALNLVGGVIDARMPGR